MTTNPVKILESVDSFGIPIQEEQRWSEVIKGEWWIDDSGFAEYADVDIGDTGHEGIAIRSVIGGVKEELEEELIAWYTDSFDEDEVSFDWDLKKLKDTLGHNWEDEMAEVYIDGGIPAVVGEKVLGAEKWKLLRDDPLTSLYEVL